MQSANGAAPPPPMAAPPVDPQAAQQYAYPYHQQQPYPMVMYPPQGQPQPMWNPQQPYAAAPPQQAPEPAGADEVRTLWIGDLQYWMDDTYLQSCFPSINNEPQVLSIKVIRNRQTNQPEGYGFIEFVSHAVAERVLQTYNGTTMPNGGQKFRLNWASFSAGGRRSDESPDYTIFVGDLAADVTDYTLQEAFRARYSSFKSAKVVIDRLTGHTKGYGFVKFGDESEQIRAMTEMNGVFCSSRPMRIGPANNKKPGGSQQYPNASYQNAQGAQNENDSNNTTIFVGGLDSSVTDEQLRQLFAQYGELMHVKIPLNKGCGFVQFVDRSSAEEALRGLQGTPLGGQNVRLSWGRSPANKQQPQQDANQWNGAAAAAAAAAGYYGYQPGMESYGYVAAPQDPNMYYGGGYPAAYGNYQQQPAQPQHQVGGYS